MSANKVAAQQYMVRSHTDSRKTIVSWNTNKLPAVITCKFVHKYHFKLRTAKNTHVVGCQNWC